MSRQSFALDLSAVGNGGDDADVVEGEHMRPIGSRGGVGNGSRSHMRSGGSFSARGSRHNNGGSDLSIVGQPLSAREAGRGSNNNININNRGGSAMGSPRPMSGGLSASMRPTTAPMVPGLSPRVDTWVQRQNTGFQKHQVLSQEQRGGIIRTRYHRESMTAPPGGQTGGGLGDDMEPAGPRPGSGFPPDTFARVAPVSPSGRRGGPRPSPRAARMQQRAATANGYGASPNMYARPGRPATTTSTAMMAGATGTGAGGSPRPRVAHFVATERQVLRFFAYMLDVPPAIEHGPLGPAHRQEQPAVRRMTILLYLVDGTLSILEERAPNSGLPGGQFFRRALAHHPDGTPIGPMDFEVGGEFRFLGRTMFIVDADANTRQHMKKQCGRILAPAMSYPEPDLPGNGSISRASSAASGTTPSSQSHLHIVSNEMRAEDTTGLGSPHSPRGRAVPGIEEDGSMQRITRGPKSHVSQNALDASRRFYLHDRHVLRFYAVVDPSASSSNTSVVKDFWLLYYLADGQIELRVRKEMLQGQTLPGTALRKQPIARNWRALRGNAASSVEADYYGENDLRCGCTVDLYGRELILVSCDQFTRDYYRVEHGIEQREIPRPKTSRPAPTPKFQMYTQTVQNSLPIGEAEPDEADKDGQQGVSFEKMQRNRGRLLRCVLVLESKHPCDEGRRFVLTYYLEDDTLSIFEGSQANSGVMGGKFLRRGRYKNLLPAEGGPARFFHPWDFVLEARIMLPNHTRMIVKELDNISLQFCEENPEEYPFSDIFRISGKLLKYVMQHQVDVRAQFKAADTQNAQQVDKATFESVMHATGMKQLLHPHEQLTVWRRFTDHRHGDASCAFFYPEFADTLCHLLELELERAADTTQYTAAERFERGLAMRRTQWRKQFRRLDGLSNSPPGLLALDEIVKLLATHDENISEQDKQYIARSFAVTVREQSGLDQPGGPNQFTTNPSIAYHDLCDQIYNFARSRLFEPDFELQDAP